MFITKSIAKYIFRMKREIEKLFNVKISLDDYTSDKVNFVVSKTDDKYYIKHIFSKNTNLYKMTIEQIHEFNNHEREICTNFINSIISALKNGQLVESPSIIKEFNGGYVKVKYFAYSEISYEYKENDLVEKGTISLKDIAYKNYCDLSIKMQNIINCVKIIMFEMLFDEADFK